MIPYRLILADPPWEFDNYGQARHGAARAHYDLLSDADLAALPVSHVVADTCALALWAPDTVITEGRHVPIMRAWGFRPVTVLFKWRKVYRSGKPYCGLGYYTRSSGEQCLLGLRGGPHKPASRNVREEIEDVVRRHSRKPAEQYERLDALWPDALPRLELFARERRSGWDALGDAIDRRPITQGLEEMAFPLLQPRRRP